MNQAFALRPSGSAPPRPGRPPPRSSRRKVGLATVTLVAQLLWPLALASQAPTGALTPIPEAELVAVSGGCLSGCGGSRGSGAVRDSSPRKTGSEYWEFAYRSLIARPSVAGNLIWHRVNDTDQHWGPFDVTYTYRESFDWSLGGSVPSGFVKAHIGGEYQTSRQLVERFTIPPRTYYKFFVAYPYERWRYFYRKYQDYSDNTRRLVASGDATVYDQWTKSTLVQGRAY